MINKIWLILIVSGMIVAVINGNMASVSEAIFQSATDSVKICLNLLGPMALWLGIMKIARKADLIKIIARFLKPVINYIFPDIADNEDAGGAVVLNLSANIFGLGNSATPLGIKAMQELQKINSDKKIASPAMCTLLALNTSSITIIPATIIALRAASGSNQPAIIISSTIFATTFSTFTAIFLDKIFRSFKGIV